MFQCTKSVLATAAVLSASAWALTPSPAAACGGLFCSSTNPVNQAAEQIIFSKNADGSVTAVIQILYEGPSQKFAWVLPVPGVPKVGVSSDQAFAALKQGTNPQYNLQTMLDPSCPQALSGKRSAPGLTPPVISSDGHSAVTVEASGAIGPYDYDVISVDPKLSDRAQVAVDWLTLHSYDVGPMGADVLRPYLMDDLNLIAFKLTKSASTGSIRPVMLTYQAELPSIPIRPTAVAANDDMGVLVWVLGSARAIPQNYKALELNEALIDWFNPNNTYNEVVSKAADQAMGQGFVTEYADKTASLTTLGVRIFDSSQQQMWTAFSTAKHIDAISLIRDASTNWGSWDGFDDALGAAVTLPSSIAAVDFKRCVACYINSPGVVFDPQKFIAKLEELVIKPMADTQALLDSLPYVTRLYTTMSAAEMTTDPAFDINADLKSVSNIHQATQYLGCNDSDPNYTPWRVTLAQGDEVRGTMAGVWPVAMDDQPAALKILAYGKSGQGKVVEDKTAAITKLLKAQNAKVASMTPSTGSGSAGTGTFGTDAKPGEGCRIANAPSTATTWPWLLSLAALWLRRRR
jgi:hypothetical protein